MTKHVHVIDPRFLECTGCHATAEQIYRGEAAHPGKPTSERLWDLMWRLMGVR